MVNGSLISCIPPKHDYFRSLWMFGTATPSTSWRDDEQLVEQQLLVLVCCFVPSLLSGEGMNLSKILGPGRPKIHKDRPFQELLAPLQQLWCFVRWIPWPETAIFERCEHRIAYFMYPKVKVAYLGIFLPSEIVSTRLTKFSSCSSIDPKYLNLSDIAVHLQSWRFNSPTAGYLQLHSFDLELLRRKKAKWKEINILLPRFGRGVSASKTDNIINQHSCESSHLIGVWSAKHIAWLSRFWNYYRYSFPVCHPALWTAFPSLASPYIWLQYTRRHLMCWMLHLEKWKWCLLLLQRRKTPSPEVGMSSTLVKSRTAVRKHHIVDNTCLQILSDIHRKTCLHHDELNRK